VSYEDKTWKYYGKTDPYFGVLTNPQFKRENLDPDAKSAFFASGEQYVDHILHVVRDHLDHDFEPTRALDFGCGVGRLAIPLARRCQAVVGVDISESMLEEGERNAREAGLSNLEWVTSDDTLSRVTGTFDFVHSFIVFQHIPCDRGYMFARTIVDRLRDGGVGVLHFSYANSTVSPPPITRRALTAAYTTFPSLYGVRNVLRGASFREPLMQMNLYDLNTILGLLQEAGCHDVHVRFTEASHFRYPVYGVILFFSKRRLDVRSFS
jgi:2-polyprenyl-3-methyl-5-hydroxy-6-metoxy-1,4-benzoquinol methylase